MSQTERIHLVTGVKDGYSYILITSAESPREVTTIYYGQSDACITKNDSRRDSCRVPPQALVKSPWTKWIKKESSSNLGFTTDDYSIPISVHKKVFGGRTPYWADKFSDRSISIQQIDKSENMVRLFLDGKYMEPDFFRVERECIINEKHGQEVYVERCFDALGRKTKISVIVLHENKRLFTLHQENKVRKGVWERTTREVDDRSFVGKTWSTFRDLPDMWSKYF